MLSGFKRSVRACHAIVLQISTFRAFMSVIRLGPVSAERVRSAYRGSLCGCLRAEIAYADAGRGRALFTVHRLRAFLLFERGSRIEEGDS